MPKITVRETVGLLLIVAALVLIPVAWAFTRLLWGLALLLLFAGGMCFYTERVLRLEQERIKRETATRTGPTIPSDIYNYTGWASGGRSETMDSSLESGDADAD